MNKNKVQYIKGGKVMYAFMTTGTSHFLKKITDQHPKIDFHFMRSGTSTLVYYESTRKKGIFVSGRTFEVLYSFGDIYKKGFIVMQHIPVTDDGMKIFEENARNQLPIFQARESLIATRLLKQLKSRQYIILTQWRTEQEYIKWKKSDQSDQFDFTKMARLPAYFAERPFTSTYTMMKDDEEDRTEFDDND